jgi:hypothetical protein
MTVRTMTRSPRTGPRFAIALLLFIIACAAACDGGLAPLPEGPSSTTPGISGTITVRSHWPAQDSLRDLRVVAFRDYPPGDILAAILAGKAVFSEPLPLHQSPIRFIIQDPAMTGRFAYVAVAWQYGPALDKDWYAVGVYALSGDPAVPTAVDIPAGNLLEGIDINADFIHLPPQPF